MGSSDSSSFISEPPDVRNWFPSYVYESPVLGSADGFKDSSFSALAEVRDDQKNGEGVFLEVGSESKEEDLLADEKGMAPNGLRAHNQADEAFETADSLSQVSEPPDIRNWFPSYVYESPSLDTCFEFGSHPIEDEIDEEENHAPNSITRKKEKPTNTRKAVGDDPIVQITPSDGIGDCCNSSLEADRKNYPAMLNASMPEETQEKDFEASTISRGRRSPSDFDAEFQIKVPENRPQKSILRNHPTEGKENAGTRNAEDGFISTRKGKRREADNSSRKSMNERVRVLEKGNEEGIGTRKVMLETTNIQLPTVDVVENTGKWKCPRKSKPYLGPPLKQLRLEKWVRRV